MSKLISDSNMNIVKSYFKEIVEVSIIVLLSLLAAYSISNLTLLAILLQVPFALLFTVLGILYIKKFDKLKRARFYSLQMTIILYFGFVQSLGLPLGIVQFILIYFAISQLDVGKKVNEYIG
jgi:hypothetical protein